MHDAMAEQLARARGHELIRKHHDEGRGSLEIVRRVRRREGRPATARAVDL